MLDSSKTRNSYQGIFIASQDAFGVAFDDLIPTHIYHTIESPTIAIDSFKLPFFVVSPNYLSFAKV
jgi:hypothetical protein